MAAKRDPHLISYCRRRPPPTSSLGLSKLDFILQKQSGMNNSFSTPSFCSFSSSVLSLSLSFFDFCVPFFLLMSLLIFVSPFLFSFPSQCSPSENDFFLLSRSVWLGDLCFSHLQAWLNPPVCVVEPNAVIRMITICPPPFLVALNLNSSSSFCLYRPESCLLKWSDWPYLPNNSTLNGKANVSLRWEFLYEFFLFDFASRCWILMYKPCTDQEECEAAFLRKFMFPASMFVLIPACAAGFIE